MELIKNIVIFSLPVIFLATALVLIVRYLLRFYSQRLIEERKRETSKTTLNLRLQAYERIMLFLERIHPVQLVGRIRPDNITASQYRMMVLENIREEFEHNITQQLYVSEALWNQVKSAKERIIGLINATARDLEPDAPALSLATRIVEQSHNQATGQLDLTIRQLKKEISALL